MHIQEVEKQEALQKATKMKTKFDNLSNALKQNLQRRKKIQKIKDSDKCGNSAVGNQENI
jgi:hypothetical protein